MNPRETFNNAAKLYDEVRPSYPDQSIDWIIKETGITVDDELFEIAPGTGQATRKFAERGFKIHAVELGDNLATLLLKNMQGKPVTVEVSSFEDWRMPKDKKYKMIYCATAFHWIDEDVKYKKTSELLETGGYLVLLWNNSTGSTDNEILAEAHRLKDECLERPGKSLKAKSEEEIKEQVQKSIDEIEASGQYKVTGFNTHRWTLKQPKRNLIKGFYSQSSYLGIEEPKKSLLTVELEKIFERLEDEVETDFITNVYVCKKL